MREAIRIVGWLISLSCWVITSFSLTYFSCCWVRGVDGITRVIFVMICWMVVGAIGCFGLFTATHYSKSLVSHVLHLHLSLVPIVIPPTNSHYSSPKYSPKSCHPCFSPSLSNSPSVISSHYSLLSHSSSRLSPSWVKSVIGTHPKTRCLFIKQFRVMTSKTCTNFLIWISLGLLIPSFIPFWASWSALSRISRALQSTPHLSQSSDPPNWLNFCLTYSKPWSNCTTYTPHWVSPPHW